MSAPKPMSASWLVEDDAIRIDGDGRINWDDSYFEAQEYESRWCELAHFVQIWCAAELHTMDVLERSKC